MSDYDPLNTKANEQARKDREDRESQNSRQAAEDLKWLMSDKRGRRIMWRLLSITGVFRNPFTGTSQTFFNCGEMNIGQRYLADITDNCPERFIEMQQEQKNHVNGPKQSSRQQRK